MARRAALLDANRLQLVGVRPLDAEQRLRNGVHLVDPDQPDESLGYITSSTPATEQVGWLGLALLRGGHQRHGTRLLARAPMFDEVYDVEIVSPHHLDPENVRVRA